MSLALAQASAFVFSFVPNVDPIPSLAHRSHLGQQISHIDEGAEFPGAGLRSWGPGVSYRASADTQSRSPSHFVPWPLPHQQSPQVKLFSGH